MRVENSNDWTEKINCIRRRQQKDPMEAAERHGTKTGSEQQVIKCLRSAPDLRIWDPCVGVNEVLQHVTVTLKGAKRIEWQSLIKLDPSLHNNDASDANS